MAINVTLNRIQSAYANGQVMEVLDPAPLIAESVSNGATSTATTGAAPAGIGNAVWRICGDTAVWVAFGASPTAAAGTDHYLPAGAELFVAARPGDKVAVINA